ncbi:hypothetical protein SDC9_206905 [bioreactor metagenome]|uniref:Uncharacterized protein n=1 Tax=bioreactor metagenome TaxID=1076179 RepID=A0A645J632_9ZZZZ
MQGQHAVSHGGDHRGKRADCGRFGRRCPTRQHAADHRHEDTQQRHHIPHEGPPARPTLVLSGVLIRWRQAGIGTATQHDIAQKTNRHHQPGQDAANQQLRDRNACKAAQHDRQRRRRDQHRNAAHRHDRPHGQRRVIPPAQHLR